LRYHFIFSFLPSCHPTKRRTRRTRRTRKRKEEKKKRRKKKKNDHDDDKSNEKITNIDSKIKERYPYINIYDTIKKNKTKSMLGTN